MTDREAIMALYKAIEKLYTAVTGEPLSVVLQTEAGEVTIQNFGATREVRIASGTADQAV